MIKSKYRTVLGRVSCDPHEIRTPTGWRLVAFTIELDGGKRELPAKFMQKPEDDDGQSFLKKLEAQGLCRDVKATFSGSMSGDELLVNKWFGQHKAGEKKTSHPGGVKAASVDAKKWNEARERAGFVFCLGTDGRHFWHPKDDAVMCGKDWKTKIDFVCDVLGHEVVMDELRQNGLVRKLNEIDFLRYHEVKEQLVKRAKEEIALYGE